MAALEQILASASTQGIAVLIYVPPLRSDVQPPYDPTEYANFKSEVEALAAQYGQSFTVLEGLVPGVLWGTMDATSLGGAPVFDFMHFQGAGHDLLAGALLEILMNRENDL